MVPARFLPRPRLTDQLADAPVALLEAPSGYGKSALAAEFCRQMGDTSAHVLLQPSDAKPEAFVGRLRGGLRAAGLSDAADRLDPPADPHDAVDALLELLHHRAEPIVLVVDHLRHVDGDVVAVLQQLTTGLPDPIGSCCAGASWRLRRQCCAAIPASPAWGQTTWPSPRTRSGTCSPSGA